MTPKNSVWAYVLLLHMVYSTDDPPWDPVDTEEIVILTPNYEHPLCSEKDHVIFLVNLPSNGSHVSLSLVIIAVGPFL